MKKLVASAMVLGLVLSLSCSGGEAAKLEALLIVTVDPYWASSDSLDVEGDLVAEVMPDTAACELKLNNVTLEENSNGPYIWFWNFIPMASTASLAFTSEDFGDATGQVSVPRDTVDITAPADSDTILAGQDVLVQWEDVPSDFFWVEIMINFWDSTNSWLSANSMDFALTGTSYTIPGDSLTVPGAAYAQVDIDVSPVYGPFPEPGAEGNLSGDVKGFLHAFGYYSEITFYAGTPMKGFVPMSHEKPSLARRTERIKELLGY
jgi:hypothetical protein